MAPFKRKPPQPRMSKAELRAQGVQALAQVITTDHELADEDQKRVQRLRSLQLRAGRTGRGGAGVQVFDLRLARHHAAG
jgi:hypothetical protein